MNQTFFLIFFSKEREKFASRKHLHEAIDELRKFNARRKLKVRRHNLILFLFSTNILNHPIMKSFIQGAILAAVSSSSWSEIPPYSTMSNKISPDALTKHPLPSLADFDDMASSGKFLTVSYTSEKNVHQYPLNRT